jgi:hypothetical protein
MSTEKFFENGGRPVDTDKSTAHFLNGVKSEVDISSDTIRSGSSSPLPAPASANQPKSKQKLSAAAIIPIWIVLSSSVIIYNNYLYNTRNFKFPVFLVTFHLGFAVRTPPTHSALVPAHLIFRNFPKTGSWHTHTATDDTPPRWSKRYPPHKGHVYAFYPPHRPSLQRKPHPE